MNQKRIKKFSSLAYAKYRRKFGLFLVEGAHAVDELLRSGWEIESIIVSGEREYSNVIRFERRLAIEKVSSKALGKIATTKTPQDIIAIARIPENDLTQVKSHERIVIANDIKDPGNLGTIIRTAAAFDFDAVLTTAGSVDLFCPKVVRSTQGALFFMNVAQHLKCADIIEMLKPSHKFYSLTARGDKDPDEIRVDKKAVLVLGAEISGVDNRLLDVSDFLIRIPISRSVESLNAAVAAGIAMYKFRKHG